MTRSQDGSLPPFSCVALSSTTPCRLSRRNGPVAVHLARGLRLPDRVGPREGSSARARGLRPAPPAGPSLRQEPDWEPRSRRRFPESVMGEEHGRTRPAPRCSCDEPSAAAGSHYYGRPARADEGKRRRLRGGLFAKSRLLLRLLEEGLVLAVAFFFELLGRDETERGRVHAVALPGRRRTVVEDVAQVRIRVHGADFVSGNAQAKVPPGLDVGFLERSGEARPARAGIVLVE